MTYQVDSALGSLIVWTTLNAVADGLILRVWLARRSRAATVERQRLVCGGEPAPALVAARRRRQITLGVIAGITVAAAVWAWLGLLPAQMTANTWTSGLRIERTYLDEGSPTTLHLQLHLDSAALPDWPVYLLVDGAPASCACWTLVDFSWVQDQTVDIVGSGAEPGRHTLTWGYAVKRTDPNDYYASTGGTIEFDVPGSTRWWGGATSTDTAATLFYPAAFAASTGLLLLFLWQLFRARRTGRIATVDDSVLLPEPVDGLTPSLAAVLRRGRIGKEAYAAAVADLVAKGRLTVGDSGETEVRRPPQGTSSSALDEPEAQLLEALSEMPRTFDGGDMANPGPSSRRRFDSALALMAARTSWFRTPPPNGPDRWTLLGRAMALVGLPLWLILSQPNLTKVNVDDALWRSFEMIGFAGVVIAVAGYYLYCNRSQDGGEVMATAQAYRNTLLYELITADTAQAGLASIQRRAPWLKGPEEAVPWILALDLRLEVETLLRRSSEAGEDSGDAARVSQLMAAVDSMVGRGPTISHMIARGLG
jgi:hypothetical protein